MNDVLMFVLPMLLTFLALAADAIFVFLVFGVDQTSHYRCCDEGRNSFTTWPYRHQPKVPFCATDSLFDIAIAPETIDAVVSATAEANVRGRGRGVQTGKSEQGHCASCPIRQSYQRSRIVAVFLFTGTNNTDGHGVGREREGSHHEAVSGVCCHQRQCSRAPIVSVMINRKKSQRPRWYEVAYYLNSESTTVVLV